MTLRRELLAGIPSAKLLPSLFTGSMMGAVLVLHCLALSAILFSGPLLPFAAQGVGILLLGGVVYCLLTASTSGIRGVLSTPQDIPAVVLAVAAATMSARLSGAGDEALRMTMVALLALAGTVTGACCLAIGHFRLADLFRFIPYTVMSGLFAGAGWALSLAALSVMSGVTPDWQGIPRFFAPEVLWKWGPGAAYALVLLFIMKRWNSFPAVAASLVLVCALYHLVLVLLDISVDDAKAAGLLLSGMAEGSLWPAFRFDDLGYVSWGVLAALVPDLLIGTAVTVFSLLIALSGLEIATGAKFDWNKEFKVTGFAGLVAGLAGSSPGCHSLTYSLPSWMFGADTRLTGLVASAVLGLTLFFGGGMLGVLPTSVIGGLLLFIGLDLLGDLLFATRKRLNWVDYGVVLIVFVTIALFGFMVGVGIGLSVAVFLFALRFSQVEVVEDEFTGRERRSTKLRSLPERAILMDQGKRIRGYRLRGYIFFGNAHRMVSRMAQSLREAPVPTCIVLDFSAVSGFDFSVVNALGGFATAANSAGTRMVLSAAPEQLEKNLESLLTEIPDRVRFEADMDHALERCEDMVLAMGGTEGSDAESARNHLLELTASDMEKYMDRRVIFEEMVDELAPWLEPRTYEAGEALAALGETPEGLQFLLSGRASVHDSEGAVLFQSGPGDVVERRAAFGGNTTSAATIAQGPCRTMMLTPASRLLLESDAPELSLKLYRFLAGYQPAALSREMSTTSGN